MNIDKNNFTGFYRTCAAAQRLAFTTMNSMPLEAADCGMQRLSSLTNLQSLQLNAHDVGPVLEAVPSVPTTLRSLELHLTGDNWQSSILDKIATQLGSQVSTDIEASRPQVTAGTQMSSDSIKL
jgi:hypothetical protein